MWQIAAAGYQSGGNGKETHKNGNEKQAYEEEERAKHFVTDSTEIFRYVKWFGSLRQPCYRAFQRLICPSRPDRVISSANPHVAWRDARDEVSAAGSRSEVVRYSLSVSRWTYELLSCQLSSKNGS